MEKKSAKLNREPSRMEKIKTTMEESKTVTPLIKLKQALKTKTMWMAIGGLAVLLTFSYEVKPWYEKQKAKEAEEYANFLWEKSHKKSIEQ